MRTSLLLSVLFLLLGACGDDWWLRHHLPHGPSQPGSGSGGGDDDEALADFVGSWRELDSAPGYTAFMLLDADGQGYLCNEDGKSQAEFELLVEAGKVHMGSYEYGAGDELALSQGEIVRTGVDHGETYTVRYASVASLPDWCRLQIGEMQRN